MPFDPKPNPLEPKPYSQPFIFTQSFSYRFCAIYSFTKLITIIKNFNHNQARGDDTTKLRLNFVFIHDQSSFAQGWILKLSQPNKDFLT